MEDRGLTTQLRPHLDGHAENDTLENARLDECGKAGLGFLTLETKSILDLLVLGEDFGMVYIASSVKVGQDCESFLPAILGGEPTRGIWEEEKANKENSTRHGLNTCSRVTG